MGYPYTLFYVSFYTLTVINFSTGSASSVLFIASRRSSAKTNIVFSVQYLSLAGIYLTMYSFKAFICLPSFFGAGTFPPLIYLNISKDILFVNRSRQQFFIYPIWSRAAATRHSTAAKRPRLFPRPRPGGRVPLDASQYRRLDRTAWPGPVARLQIHKSRISRPLAFTAAPAVLFAGSARLTHKVL